MKNTQQLSQTLELTHCQQNINSTEDLAISLADPTYTSCPMKNQGFMICITETCDLENPFICFSTKCTCQQIHKQCDQKRIDAIQQVIAQKHKHKQAFKQSFIDSFQSINDQISDFCDNIASKISLTGKLTNSSSDDVSEYNKINKALILEELTGSLVHRVFNTSKLLHEKNNLLQKKEKLKERCEKFQKHQLKEFLREVENLIMPAGDQNILQFCDSSLKGGIYDKMNSKRIKSEMKMTFTDNINVAAIIPTISEIYEMPELQRYKIRVVRATGDIKFGVMKLKMLEQNQFSVDRSVCLQLGNLFSANECNNQKKSYSSNYTRKVQKLKNGDVFEVSLNPFSQKVTFTSERLGTSKSIPVLHTPKNRAYDSVIVIGIDSADSEVEIFSESDSETKQQQNEGNKKLIDTEKEKKNTQLGLEPMYRGLFAKSQNYK